jgi:electron transfer flavoprotein beta subunit
VKILVLIKETPDTDAKISLSAGGKAVDHAQTKYVVNPYDDFAIEETLKIKERNNAEVVAASFAPAAAKERIIKALAMGADRGIIIENSGLENLDALGIATVLKALVLKENPDLVLCGKQGIDDDNMHVPVMLAELLNWPSVNVVSKLEEINGGWRIEREVEGGQKEIYEVTGPVILGAHKSLNQPRYTSLPGIMKAKKKPFDGLKPQDLGVDTNTLKALSQTQYENFAYPPEKPQGKIFAGEDLEVMVDKVVQLLKTEAKVL